VPRISAPSLVIWGRGNRQAPVEQGRRLARELKGARFEVFDCGRSPAEERPELFANTVTSFLVSRGVG
jgi:pimeloyl-ACP methyl ester carboxylesterase